MIINLSQKLNTVSGKEYLDGVGAPLTIGAFLVETLAEHRGSNKMRIFNLINDILTATKSSAEGGEVEFNISPENAVLIKGIIEEMSISSYVAGCVLSELSK